MFVRQFNKTLSSGIILGVKEADRVWVAVGRPKCPAYAYTCLSGQGKGSVIKVARQSQHIASATHLKHNPSHPPRLSFRSVTAMNTAHKCH
ncbi:hypothetical protein E2C01_042670 [Portunus trituberculatus]|uniref:Uncharacterized protein n=1 Tax=Portunus trituberculatus TaxID=210409 RepID=A0A5B7FX50_PORTR|nr:hypothetical protein [Portunus trituberculatus]